MQIGRTLPSIFTGCGPEIRNARSEIKTRVRRLDRGPDTFLGGGRCGQPFAATIEPRSLKSALCISPISCDPLLTSILYYLFLFPSSSASTACPDLLAVQFLPNLYFPIPTNPSYRIQTDYTALVIVEIYTLSQ